MKFWHCFGVWVACLALAIAVTPVEAREITPRLLELLETFA